VTQPAPGELSDGELVIAAAAEERERVRSGKGIRLQAAAILVLAALGCWLALVLGRVPYVGYVGIGLGVIVAVIMVLSAFGMFVVSPLAPWGNAVRDCCPGCGQRTLREGRAVHGEVPGPGTRTIDGIVTLCTSGGCGYAAVRSLRHWQAAR
jgi:hypothetical protein